MKNKKQKTIKQKGAAMMIMVVFTSIFGIMIGGIISVIIYQNRLNKKLQAKESALQISEAGINYYRWHLAHDDGDFANGTTDTCNYPTSCGPYQRDYYDPLTGNIGKYELSITPPPTGSTVVTLKSKGWIIGYENQARTIEVKYGIPSLAAFSFLTNSDAWFGASEGVVGPMHSNGGIRMDGTNDSIVTSARSTYTCTSDHDCNPDSTQNGVWGAGTGSALWQFPVPAIDFNAISLDLAQIKNDANTDGIYYNSATGSDKGYKLIFKSDGTIDIYEVDSLEPSIKQLNDNWSGYENIADQPEDLTFITNESAPNNGLIFIKDNIWVEGVVNGRFTLVSAKLTGSPSNYTNIVITNNLTYLNRDGSNSLGLIAEKHIKVPSYAPTDLTIDAIMLAQNGRVFYNLHKEDADRTIKNSITVYGSIITNNIWTWTWVDGPTTLDGYNSTISIYDNDATFAPPPSFPTTGEYTFVSWEEKLEGEP